MPFAACFLALALVACSPLAEIASDRQRDLAAIAAQPRAAQVPLLRERVLRDGMNVRIRATGPGVLRENMSLQRRIALSIMLADDYLALGHALDDTDDADAAIRAFEDAIVIAEKSEGPEASRVRVSAYRAEQTLWAARGEKARSEAARIFADSAALPDKAERSRQMSQAAKIMPDEPAVAIIRRAADAPAHGITLWALAALRSGVPIARIDKTMGDAPRAATPARPPEPPAPPIAAPPAPPTAAPAAPPPPGAPAKKEDVGARLKKLDELKARKVITDEEYKRERERILKEEL